MPANRFKNFTLIAVAETEFCHSGMASFEVEVLKVVFEKLEVGGWGVEMVVD